MALPSVPILTVVQMDRVKILLEVPEQDLAQIRPNMTARISVARFPQREFEGQVTRIFPTIDRVTRTAQVQVDLENKEGNLLPGMLAQIRLEVIQRKNVVVIPYSSIVMEMGAQGEITHRAFIVTGPVAQERALTLGIIDGQRVEITEGLAKGELLVTQGQHLLQSGQKIKIVEEQKVEEERPPAESAPKKPSSKHQGGRRSS
jgi:membrane fusion protein (multidrug efflux system)